MSRTPWDLPYPPLLCFSVACTWFVRRKTREVRMWWLMAGTNAVCVSNLVLWHDTTIQTYAHDAYVFILVYVLVASTCSYMLAIGRVFAVCQLCTRWWCDRCAFMWWQNSRNRDADMGVCLLLAASAVARARRRPLCSAWWCVLITAAARALPDASGASLLWCSVTTAWYYMRTTGAVNSLCG